MRNGFWMQGLWVPALCALACGCGGDDDDASGDSPPNHERDAGRHKDGGGIDQVRELDFDRFDVLLEDFADDKDLVGMGAAIVDRNRGVVHMRGYGDIRRWNDRGMRRGDLHSG